MPVLIQLWSCDGLCLKLDHEGREAKPVVEGERGLKVKMQKLKLRSKGQEMTARDEA